MLRALFGIIFTKMGTRASARPKKKRKRVGAKQMSEASFAPTSSEGSGNPRVLIANLAGDKGGAETEHLTGIFAETQIWEVYQAGKALKVGGPGTLVEQLIAAAEEGHGWLQDESADLLVWGEVEGDMLRVRFLPAVPAADNQPGAVGLGDNLFLPKSFGVDLASALLIGALAAVGPTFRGLRGKVGGVLNEALQNVKELMRQKPEGFDSEQYACLLTTIGNGFAAHSQIGGSEKRLDHAVTAYDIAGKFVTSESAEVTWALGLSHKAAALRAKGEKGKDEAALKSAAKTYQAITSGMSRVAHPFDWALAHINLGFVLYRLFTLSGRAAYLQEASKSYEEALIVYDKGIMPGKWAEVTNQYGVVLLALGEHVNGNTTLEQAVKRFRQSLGVRKRETVPELWAQTANNLGAACFSLAKRDSEAALLREAVSCFEGAREVYDEAGAHKKAQVIAANMARVQRLMESRGD